MYNKKAVIAGLLAVVLVMAVGYSVFATTLNITGTAKVAANWDVGFNTDTSSVIKRTNGVADNDVTDISFSGTDEVTVTPSLSSPGDSVEYTFIIKNDGNIVANLETPTLSNPVNCTISGLTCTSTSGNIKFTVSTSTSTIQPEGTGSITLKAEFVDRTVASSSQETASVTVGFKATQ